MKDEKESVRVKRLVRSKPKQCYCNAARVVLAIPEYADADYVEGLAVLAKVMVIEHGWVEKDGVIIDPTLPHDGLQYFPGLRFRGQRGLAEAMKIPKPEWTQDDAAERMADHEASAATPGAEYVVDDQSVGESRLHGVVIRRRTGLIRWLSRSRSTVAKKSLVIAQVPLAWLRE